MSFFFHMGISPQICVLKIVCFLYVCNAFTPTDNYLIDCGSPTNTTINSRLFLADVSIASSSSSSSTMTVSTPQTIFANTSSEPVSSFDVAELYRTARIFTGLSSYTFPMRSSGRHFVRLYFFPFVYGSYNLTAAKFGVSAQNLLLMSSFDAKNGSTAVLKEYSLNITSDTLVLSFLPLGEGESSIAFVNAIEVVSVPDDLIADSFRTLSPAGTGSSLSEQALETAYRNNMGGVKVSPAQDTLWRTWTSDRAFLLNANLAKFVNFSGHINYVEGGATDSIAPYAVYGTATRLAASDVNEPAFNVTWEFDVDAGPRYLVRMHFCDIVSKALNELYFNVYINGMSAVRDLDLSSSMNALAAPYYMDFVVGVSDAPGKIRISIGPSSLDDVLPDAILNGLEIMKMNISADGFGGETSDRVTKNLGVILVSVFGSLAAVILLAACLIFLWLRRRRVTSKRLLSKSYGNSWGSGASKRRTTSNFGDTNLGLHCPFIVLQEATNNFDESFVIGVGGFGKVYKGELDDGTKVAVKRGSPSSQQGLKEFRTEIELLSQLRHRHLVSLIGYCDERGEMILVYEYMEKGTLKSHLYGSDFLPRLSWEQRLEACIGSAKGLHYLHTGFAKAVIHRDVKSANILLDENLLAKVADFGLSKTGPELDQTHVSTAVKGSFGYLDPEYFRRQKLTEKSDVYSFGVVMFEVLCARPVIDPTRARAEVNLAECAMRLIEKGELGQIVDPHLAGKVESDSLRKFAETAGKCLAEHGVDRPTMGDVLWNLEYCLQLQEARPSSSEEDSINRIADFSAQLREVVGVVSRGGFTPTSCKGSEASVKTMISSQLGENDSQVSMNKIFSQLVKSEGR